MKKLFFIIILSILLLSGCTQSPDNLIFTGTIEATQVDVASDIGGIIIEIGVEEGDFVQEGQIVARLDDTLLNMSTLQLGANYHATQEQLKDLKKGSKEEEINIAKSGLNMAKLSLKTAEDQYDYIGDLYDKTKELYDQGAVAEQEMEDISIKQKDADGKLQRALEEVQRMELSVELLEKGTPEEVVKSKEYHVEQSKYAFEEGKLQKEKAMVKSYMEGTVLYKNYSKGEYLSKGAPVLTLINRKDLWMKIYIPEKNIHLVKVGQNIPLVSDTLNDKKITGKVIFLSPEAEFTPSNVTTKEDRHNRVHEVKIKIIEGIEYLNPGMVMDGDLKNI